MARIKIYKIEEGRRIPKYITFASYVTKDDSNFRTTLSDGSTLDYGQPEYPNTNYFASNKRPSLLSDSSVSHRWGNRLVNPHGVYGDMGLQLQGGTTPFTDSTFFTGMLDSEGATSLFELGHQAEGTAKEYDYYEMGNGSTITVECTLSESDYQNLHRVSDNRIVTFQNTYYGSVVLSLQKYTETRITEGTLYRETINTAFLSYCYNIYTPDSDFDYNGAHCFTHAITGTYYDTDGNTEAGYQRLLLSTSVSKLGITFFKKKLTGNLDNDLKGDGDVENLPPQDPEFKPPWDGGDKPKPYEPGDYDFTDDPQPFPDIPPISGIASAFISSYKMSVTQLNNLASYLWSDDIVDKLKKHISNPMDSIVSLQLTPCNPTVVGNKNIVLTGVDTGASGSLLSSQYKVVDCGTLAVRPCWGGFWDYSGMSSASIYLPFIGEQNIDIDTCMNGTVHVKYNIDVLTGSCVAMVKCDNMDKFGNSHSVLYQFNGNCNQQIPLTSADYSSQINSLLNLPWSVFSSASTGSVGSNFVNDVTTIALNKPNVMKSGNIQSNLGWLSGKTPVLYIKRPTQALPSNFSKTNGYVSAQYLSLKDMKGYTEVETIRLDGLSCTEEEKEEITSLLKNGVIF